MSIESEAAQYLEENSGGFPSTADKLLQRLLDGTPKNPIRVAVGYPIDADTKIEWKRGDPPYNTVLYGRDRDDGEVRLVFFISAEQLAAIEYGRDTLDAMLAGEDDDYDDPEEPFDPDIEFNDSLMDIGTWEDSNCDIEWAIAPSGIVKENHEKKIKAGTWDGDFSA